MNSVIISSLFLLIPTIVFSSERSSCEDQSITDNQRQIEIDMCVDPHAVICSKDNYSKNYFKRGRALIDEIFEEVSTQVYGENAHILNQRNVSSITRDNYNAIFAPINDETFCVDDAVICHESEIQIPIHTPWFYQFYLEDTVQQRFFQRLHEKIDPKLDALYEAYNLHLERMIQITQKELKQKIPQQKIDLITKNLKESIPLFSSSDASIDRAFPNLTPHEKSIIKSNYEQSCYHKLTSDINASFGQYRFGSVVINTTYYCPADYLGEEEGADTLRSAYNSLAFLVSHELGHQVSDNLINTSVFDKFDHCMENNFAKSEILGHHTNYQNEAHADFFAKRLLGDILDDYKDYPLMDKVDLIKEATVVLCDARDDQIHHSDKHRINLAIRLIPEYRDAFNCSDHLHEMRLRKPVDCGLDGEKVIMILEL